MASLQLSELITNLPFCTFSLLYIPLALLFLYVAVFILDFIIFFVQETIHGSDRPPIAGSIFNMIIHFKTVHDFLTKLAHKNKTVRLITHYNSDIFTADPKNIEHFLKSKFSNYVKGDLNYDIMTDLLGDGIFAVDGARWRHQRKLASYEFSTKILREFSSVAFRQTAARLVEKIEDAARAAAAVDLQDLLLKSTMDSIFKVGFGVELDTLSGTDEAGVAFSEAFDESNHIIFSRFADIFWKVKRKFNIGLEARLKSNLKVIDEFVLQLISRKREEIRGRVEVKKKEDVLSRFVLASEKDATMTDRYLRDIILSFLIAGKDTSANTLTWFFYMLCKNQSVQEKIWAEINFAMEPKAAGFGIDEFMGSLTEEVLEKMQYLHAALTETLRLFPAVPADSKFAVEDDVLPDGFKVKKGDGLTYLSYAMGRMTYVWGEDAEEFKPERWLKNGVFMPASPYKFVSFHAGPRTCLGKEFAYRQMKILAATLLHFFVFKLEDEGKIATYKTMFTLHMENGLSVIPFPRLS